MMVRVGENGGGEGVEGGLILGCNGYMYSIVHT